MCQAVLHCAGWLRGPVQLPLGDWPQLRAQRHRGGDTQGPEVSVIVIIIIICTSLTISSFGLYRTSIRVALVLKKPVLKNLKLLCFIGWKWRHISFKWHFEPLYLILSAHQSWRKSLQYHYFPSSRAVWKIQCQRTLWAVSGGPLSWSVWSVCYAGIIIEYI